MKSKILYIFILLFSFSAFSGLEFSESFESPRRDVSIILTEEGYYPRTVTVFEGEEVKFTLTSTMKKGCFIMDNYQLYLGMNEGKITQGQVHFQNPGSFQFYCPNNPNHKGQIIVLKKNAPPSVKKREVASKGKIEKETVTEWLPRND